MSEVLLVENDLTVSEPLARALRREGYNVHVVSRGREALEEAHHASPDLVILDLGISDMDGLDVCRQMRSNGMTIPIILTGHAHETTIVVGLDAGADDYVTKPFRFAELLARIRASLRRSYPPQHSDDRPVKIDHQAHRAYLGGRELFLTAKEFHLLAVLHRDEGSALTREQLMREVWGTDEILSSKTLDMHISLLRQKLDDDAHAPRYIFTIRSIGFRFHNNPQWEADEPTPPQPDIPLLH